MRLTLDDGSVGLTVKRVIERDMRIGRRWTKHAPENVIHVDCNDALRG